LRRESGIGFACSPQGGEAFTFTQIFPLHR
jgi:hypothetical protein